MCPHRSYCVTSIKDFSLVSMETMKYWIWVVNLYLEVPRFSLTTKRVVLGALSEASLIEIAFCWATECSSFQPCKHMKYFEASRFHRGCRDWNKTKDKCPFSSSDGNDKLGSQTFDLTCSVRETVSFLIICHWKERNIIYHLTVHGSTHFSFHPNVIS